MFHDNCIFLKITQYIDLQQKRDNFAEKKQVGKQIYETV